MIRGGSLALAIGRYGTAAILLLFVPLKWTDVEVAAVEPLVTHSPLLAWAPRLVGMVATTRGIGAIEGVFAILMLLRPWSSRACLIGSLGATATFVTTLSFVATTPGAWSGGAPTAIGWFLLKDVLFLAGSLASVIEAAHAARRGSDGTR